MLISGGGVRKQYFKRWNTAIKKFDGLKARPGSILLRCCPPEWMDSLIKASWIFFSTWLTLDFSNLIDMLR